MIQRGFMHSRFRTVTLFTDMILHRFVYRQQEGIQTCMTRLII